MIRLFKVSLFLLMVTQINSVYGQTNVSTDIWPKVKSPIAYDAKLEADIEALLAQMSIPQKVGQLIQAEIKHISPRDVRDYHIGSVLNGGGSFPGQDAHAAFSLWVAAANAYYDASMDTSKGGLAIPIIWGTDAVHGHNNVVGATLFPHNIGLGAGNNPSLMRDIGVVTAREVAVTGIDWTFAPTVAVARDDRWGRTYESYSEDPKIVTELSKELILGLQGHPALGNTLSQEKLIATAKHFIGDGGTIEGIDQGDTRLSEQELFDIHGQGYVKAIGVGVQTVMASFSSWNGSKMHGDKYLLTDVLKEKMGFDGFVVGDWNAHEQLPGCTVKSCSAAINAGVDMIMVPEQWKAFHQNTVSQVRKGAISQERLNDAVRRILRVKIRAGVFKDGRPSQHLLAGKTALIGHPTHRNVGRQAVRESLVLLKNENILPLDPTKNILVAGEGADNLVMQAGGWSVTWQGRDNKQSDFPGATSLFQGFKSQVDNADGKIALSKTLDPDNLPDAAIIVFGETPYAETDGSLRNLDFNITKSVEFKLVQDLKAQNVPVVAIFLTGRPRWVEEAIELVDAFVVAWLPGSEGGGVGEVIFKNADGSINYDFKGKLPFTWPRNTSNAAINIGDSSYEPLYPFGFGLSYEVE